jgi:hypothetical protein
MSSSLFDQKTSSMNIDAERKRIKAKEQLLKDYIQILSQQNKQIVWYEYQQQEYLQILQFEIAQLNQERLQTRVILNQAS